MLSPQKFSKTLGKTKLKIGITINELVIASFLPIGFDIFGFDPFISFISFVVFIAAMVIKNNLLEPSYIKNIIEKKEHLEWK